MVDTVLHDLLKEVRTEQIKQGKCIVRMEVDLKDHKEGVIQNRVSIKDTNSEVSTVSKRIDKLEESKKFRKWLYIHSFKILVFISVSTAVITKIVNFW